MQTRNKMLDDFSQLMTNAMGVAQGAKEEAENGFASMVDRWLADRDFVTREEFDAVKAMAQKAREDNIDLKARVEAIENKCEGFIRIKDVPGDYFNFLENEMLLLGRHTKEEYRLGDKVLIKVMAVNQSKKQIDFSLVEKM